MTLAVTTDFTPQLQILLRNRITRCTSTLTLIGCRAVEHSAKPFAANTSLTCHSTACTIFTNVRTNCNKVLHENVTLKMRCERIKVKNKKRWQRLMCIEILNIRFSNFSFDAFRCGQNVSLHFLFAPPLHLQLHAVPLHFIAGCLLGFIAVARNGNNILLNDASKWCSLFLAVCGTHGYLAKGILQLWWDHYTNSVSAVLLILSVVGACKKPVE